MMDSNDYNANADDNAMEAKHERARTALMLTAITSVEDLASGLRAFADAIDRMADPDDVFAVSVSIGSQRLTAARASARQAVEMTVSVDADPPKDRERAVRIPRASTTGRPSSAMAELRKAIVSAIDEIERVRTDVGLPPILQGRRDTIRALDRARSAMMLADELARMLNQA